MATEGVRDASTASEINTLVQCVHHGNETNQMKLYGYQDEGLPPEEVVPATLAEVTLCATPGELRKMAAFLQYCAMEMERMGATYDHVHLSDQVKDFAASPQFVVAGASE